MNEFLHVINEQAGVKARFVGRISGVEVDTDRLATVARLEPYHRATVEEMGFSWDVCWRAEQVHGADIAVVESDGLDEGGIIDNADGLITNCIGVLLGIYVADCGAIYLVDTKTSALGLLHSGKKGTELGIIDKALSMMYDKYGTDPADVLVCLAPCIRPPEYEVDFAAGIREQAMAAGILEGNFVDSGLCTSSDLNKFYSYRVEKGSTGRMLALLGRTS